MGERPRWLVIPERKVSKKELKKLLDEWQHLLGLCSYGYRLKRVASMKNSKLRRVLRSFFEIYASDERRLLHELLHTYFVELLDFIISLRLYVPAEEGEVRINPEILKDSDVVEKIIFRLTNALLRLKYGE